MRLPSDWKHPTLKTLSESENNNNNATRNTNAALSEDRRIKQAVGTLIHRLLYQISQENLAEWENPKKLMAQESYIKNSLRSLGLPKKIVNQHALTVSQAIQRTLTDPIGKWILKPKEMDCLSEYPLSVAQDDQHSTQNCRKDTQSFGAAPVMHVVIDRTFIDDQQQRWIIDYKTSVPATDDIAQFVAREQISHAPQLMRYAKAFRQLGETLPIRLGLYFPLLGIWCEVTSDGVI